VHDEQCRQAAEDALLRKVATALKQTGSFSHVEIIITRSAAPSLVKCTYPGGHGEGVRAHFLNVVPSVMFVVVRARVRARVHVRVRVHVQTLAQFIRNIEERVSESSPPMCTWEHTQNGCAHNHESPSQNRPCFHLDQWSADLRLTPRSTCNGAHV
jgi:hypothetical protein